METKTRAEPEPEPEPAAERELDEDELALRRVLEPLGLELKRARKQPLEALDLGMPELKTPAAVTTRVAGTVNDAQLELFEYEWLAGSKTTTRYSSVVAVLRHPQLRGNARITHSAGAGLIAIVILLLPIVIIVAIISFVYGLATRGSSAKKRWNDDWLLGFKAFDRAYNVGGPSKAESAAAVPMSLQELLVREGKRIRFLEVREGLLACAFEPIKLTPATLPELVTFTTRLLDAALGGRTPPGAPFRD